MVWRILLAFAESLLPAYLEFLLRQPITTDIVTTVGTEVLPYLSQPFPVFFQVEKSDFSWTRVFLKVSGAPSFRKRETELGTLPWRYTFLLRHFPY